MKRDKFGRELTPCRFCGGDTSMLGTRLCDPCWELDRRIRSEKPAVLSSIMAANNYRIEKMEERE